MLSGIRTFGNVSVVGPDGELGWKPMHGDAREVGLSLDVLSSPSMSSALRLVKRSVDGNTGACLRAENGRNQLSICPSWEDGSNQLSICQNWEDGT